MRQLKMRLIHMAFLTLSLVLGMGCAAPPPANPAPRAALGKPVTLAIGQSVMLNDALVTITFTEVSEDSRCPTKVNCVWTGRATVNLRVQANGEPAQNIMLSTIHSPEKTNVAEAGGYRIEMTDVQPYPETPDNPISPERYRVTLTVTRAS
jgi:hypothetical protein